MKDSARFARAVRKVARSLKSAAVWNGTKEAVDGCADDYVFEMLCYFKSAQIAKKAYRLSIAGKTEKDSKGRLLAIWPKKPGYKANFSYFNLSDETTGNVAFQLCPGIRIADIHGKDRAPDVNLLSGSAPISPTHVDLKACWDAKYCSDPTKRMPDTMVSDFIHTFRQLGSPAMSKDWKQAAEKSVFSMSGLITNGDASTEPDQTLAKNGISETSGYPGNPTTRP